MSLTDLASLGSFVSGIAVLVSLIYLSLQIRQNTHLHRATAHKVRADFVTEFLQQQLDPSVAAAVLRGVAGDSSMSEVEFTQFNAITHAWFVGMSELYWLHDQGVLDEDTFTGSDTALRLRLQSPGVRAVWQIVKPMMPEPFRVNVDKVIAENPPVPLNNPFERWKSELRAQSAGTAAA